MKDLLRILRMYFLTRRELAPSALLIAVVVVADLAVPVLLMKAVDEMLDWHPAGAVVENHEGSSLAASGAPAISRMSEAEKRAAFERVVLYALLIVVAATLEYATRWKLTRIHNRAIYQGAARLRADLYARIQAQSLNYHSERRVGALLNRLMTDVAALQDASLEVLSEIPFDICTVGCLLAVMLFVHPEMAAVIAIFVAIVVLVSLFIGKRGLKRHEAAMDSAADLSANLQEALSGMRAIQTFGADDEQRARVEADAGRHAEELEEGGRDRAWTTPLYAFAEYTGLLLALIVGSWFVLHGTLTAGGLALFIAYMGYVADPAIRGATLIPKAQRAAVAAKRINELLKETEGASQAAGGLSLAKVRGEIRIEQVSFRYPRGNRPALKQVDLAVKPGERVAIIGANAAGKSTLLDILLKLQKPESGRVSVDGIDLNEISTTSWLRNVGIVLQDIALLNRTIAENIAMGAPGRNADDIRAAAKQAGVDDAIVRFPKGYDTIPGERGATLSGGERQRVAIARLFLRDPAIILLDEPTSALDMRSEAELLPALRRLCEGRTTFVVSHRLPVLCAVDRVLLLSEGRQLGFDTPARMWDQFPDHRALFPAEWSSKATAPVGAES